MISNKTLFLLILLVGGIYFFRKKATDSLIIICVLAIYLLLNKSGEHLTSSEQTEALQYLASMYNNGTLNATNLHVTGQLTVDGPSTLTGNVTTTAGITNNGPYTSGNNLTAGNITGNNITSNGVMTANKNLNVTGTTSLNGNLKTTGNIYLNPTQPLVFGDSIAQGLSSDKNTFAMYRVSDGLAITEASIPGSTNFWSSGDINYNAYTGGGILKP